MTECWMLWHGGASYGAPDVETDTEHFDSLGELRNSFDARRHDINHYPCVYDEPVDDGGPSGWIFFYDPQTVDGDAYPDRIIEYGPRGGLRITPA